MNLNFFYFSTLMKILLLSSNKKWKRSSGFISECMKTGEEKKKIRVSLMKEKDVEGMNNMKAEEGMKETKETMIDQDSMIGIRKRGEEEDRMRIGRGGTMNKSMREDTKEGIKGGTKKGRKDRRLKKPTMKNKPSQLKRRLI